MENILNLIDNYHLIFIITLSIISLTAIATIYILRRYLEVKTLRSIAEGLVYLLITTILLLSFYLGYQLKNVEGTMSILDFLTQDMYNYAQIIQGKDIQIDFKTEALRDTLERLKVFVNQPIEVSPDTEPKLTSLRQLDTPFNRMQFDNNKEILINPLLDKEVQLMILKATLAVIFYIVAIGIGYSMGMEHANSQTPESPSEAPAQQQL